MDTNTNNDSQPANAPVAAVAAGSAIPPDDWECTECGTDAQACAVIKALEEMQLDERVSLKAYGPTEDQFMIGTDEIVLCGCCHGSHWRAPNIPVSNAHTNTEKFSDHE